ncbi:MAG: hypothetical protein LUQ31_10410 [Methanoregula sp.]|nr:hypothetical protein [Methanoregula sp.]
MTACVSNDDDDEEAKRFAFSLSFVMTSCNRISGAACGFIDHAFARVTTPARHPGAPVGSVSGIYKPAGTPARVTSELIFI